MSIAPEPTFAWQPFSCRVEPDRDVVRVVPEGELDLATADQLERELDELRTAGFEHVMLDLRGLSFMDSTGLRLILAAEASARTRGTRLSLISGAPAVQRVFEVAGVADRLSWTA